MENITNMSEVEGVFMEGEKCLYMTVYTALQKKIRSGEIRSGEKLPAEKVLAEEFAIL